MIPTGDPRRAIRRLNIFGLVAVIALFGGLGTWATTAEIAGAVIAPGQIVVQSDVQKVQHQTGGTVGKILVDDGDHVKAGEVVVRLDDTVAKANLDLIQSQIDELMARQARLMAERDGADTVTYPPALLKRGKQSTVAIAMTDERKLFESRRSARLGQQAQLKEQIKQSQEQVRGLLAQQHANESQIKLIGRELESVNALYQKNLTSLSRLMTLERSKAQLEGERGQNIADIARVRGKISEIELQIIQLDRDFRNKVLKDLRDAQGKLAQLKEQRTAAQDQLEHMDLRAPVSGVVNALAVHTVGAVIGPGETVMEIVPHGARLVVEAKVAPPDVDQIALGATVSVHLEVGDQRAMPDLTGRLIYISADVVSDPHAAPQLQRPYYLVRIELPPNEIEKIKKLKGIQLLPGMMAQAFIQTYARTPLQFLLKPLRDQMARAFRER